MEIFVGQDLVQLRFNTLNEETSIGTAVLKYRKPSGASGQFEAGIDGPVVTFNPTKTSFDEVGKWTIQPVVTIQGKDGPCKPVTILVKPTI